MKGRQKEIRCKVVKPDSSVIDWRSPVKKSEKKFMEEI